jgi:methylenetetrahydrofolate dehydrogenase (NADP+)/methenyltetrahydrofolate cyclohydrolase
MTADLSGSELAAGIRAEVAAAAAELAASGTPPRLAVVVATADESSAWYVRSIARAAERTGIACSVVDLKETATPDRIRADLAALSADPAVHGIILQTPLPADAVFEDLAASIDPAKDVDGANPLSLGRLAAGLPAFAPRRRPPRPCSRCWTTTGSPCPVRTPSWSGGPPSSGSPRRSCCCSGMPP